MEEFVYEIGEETFIQKPLVLGQMRQLFELLQGTRFPTVVTVPAIVSALGSKIPTAIAIVLQRKDQKIMEKDIKEVQDLVENNLGMEESIRVIADFFDCNPIASISEAMIGLSQKMTEKMGTKKVETTSTSSAPSLPEEI